MPQQLRSRFATAPIAANASDAVIPIHKHRTYMHPSVYGSFNPAAVALAPPHAIVPVAPTVKPDDDYDGLSRDKDQCTVHRWGRGLSRKHAGGDTFPIIGVVVAVAALARLFAKKIKLGAAATGAH